MHKVITICREFGSGGREVGKRLAEILQVPYYDDEIVTELAKRTKLAESYVNQFSEKSIKTIQYYPITVGRTFHQQMNPKLMQNINLRVEQEKLLKELGSQSNCVIVGRASNYILREFDPLRVFVYAEAEAKLKRCREKAPEQEQMSDKELIKHMREIDKERARYYESVVGRRWGDKADYDIMINTTYYPIKLVAQIIAQPILFGESQ